MPEKSATFEKRTIALVDCKPHPENPQQHPSPGSPEWKVLEGSLRYDYFDPIVWNQRNGLLVSGHLRTKILRHLGVSHVDVVVVDYDDAMHLARMRAANAHTGKADAAKLDKLLASLREAGTDPVLALLEETVEREASASVREVTIKPPLTMAWTLVGVPIEEFPAVQGLLDMMPSSAIIQTSASDWRPDGHKDR